MKAEKKALEILQHDPIKCEKASLGAQTTGVVKQLVAGEASLDRRDHRNNRKETPRLCQVSEDHSSKRSLPY